MLSFTGEEENQAPQDSRLSKKVKVDFSTPTKMDTQNFSNTTNQVLECDCGTEVSSASVSARREWLKQFEKAHEDPFRDLSSKKESSEVISSAPSSAIKSRPTTSAAKSPKKQGASAESSSVTSLYNLGDRLVSEPKRNYTPKRPKARLENGQVQATNEGYASVAKLSQWLENDPTSTKKKRHVRKGKNIISKSRQFEKGLEGVIVLENKISRGSVNNQKKWLEGAFHGDDSDGDFAGLHQTGLVPRYAKSEVGGCDIGSTISVSDKKDWLKNAFGTASSDESSNNATDESRSEIITDDAASSLSVSDKKDWLKQAFQKSEGHSGKRNFRSGYPKARSDIMHCRRENRDDIAARAKRKFMERRAQRTGRTRTPSKTSNHEATIHATPESTRGIHQDRNFSEALPGISEIKVESPRRRGEVDENTGPLTPLQETGSTLESISTSKQGSAVELTYQVEEDTTPVDFQAARRLLVERGRNNGNDVHVLNKVHLRKNKFEQIEKEMKRRSNAFGLLKPSWEHADPSKGQSSDAYEKTFKEDIAPKKSFEELP